MAPKLIQFAGYWALQFPGSRPVLTSFRASVPARIVLAAVRRDYPGEPIEAPNAPGWLFEAEEMADVTVSQTALFGGAL
jgi:hypothetical protein